MKVEYALKHFRTKAAIARALDIDRSLVTRWKDGIVPLKYAWELRDVSKGRLAMHLGDYRIRALK